MTGSLPLWGGVVAIGVYHGLNPAMGWPLAVANGLGERRGSAVAATWMPLGAGHLLAMALVLVPFAALTWLVQWSREVRIGAGTLVLLFGLVRLGVRHHPRWLARVRPAQLTLWSFLMATAHGAALMLVPILLGLCGPADGATAAFASGLGDGAGVGAGVHSQTFGHGAMLQLMQSSLGAALSVSLVHTAAMIASGLGVAWLVYRYLGLQVLRTAWFDLDAVWAIGLVVSGGAAIAVAWTS